MIGNSYLISIYVNYFHFEQNYNKRIADMIISVLYDSYYSDEYSRFYLFVSQTNRKTLPMKESAVAAIGVGFDIELILKRTTIELLSTPYMERCEQDDNFEFGKQQYSNFNLFNPLIKDNLTFSSSNKLINIYTEQPEGCSQNYYKIYHEHNLLRKKGNSKFRIPGTIKIDHKYTAYPRQSYVEFVTDIGGLFGLWLGMSFIDMSELIKQFIPLTKRFLILLKKLAFFKIIRKNIFQFIRKISNILYFIKIIDWKRLFTILSIPILIFQFYKSIEDYMQFSTDLSFEFTDFDRNDTKYSLSDFPAITVCNDHIFDKIFFDNEFIEIYVKSWRWQKYKILGKDMQKEKDLAKLNLTLLSKNEHITESIKFIVREMSALDQLLGDTNLTATQRRMKFFVKYLDVSDQFELDKKMFLESRLQGIANRFNING